MPRTTTIQMAEWQKAKCPSKVLHKEMSWLSNLHLCTRYLLFSRIILSFEGHRSEIQEERAHEKEQKKEAMRLEAEQNKKKKEEHQAMKKKEAEKEEAQRQVKEKKRLQNQLQRERKGKGKRHKKSTLMNLLVLT